MFSVGEREGIVLFYRLFGFSPYLATQNWKRAYIQLSNHQRYLRVQVFHRECKNKHYPLDQTHLTFFLSVADEFQLSWYDAELVCWNEDGTVTLLPILLSFLCLCSSVRRVRREERKRKVRREKEKEGKKRVWREEEKGVTFTLSHPLFFPSSRNCRCRLPSNWPTGLKIRESSRVQTTPLDTLFCTFAK
jgi:hypothetical protein